VRARWVVAGLVVLAGSLPLFPGSGSAAGAAATVPAVFAAGAEAWAYSVEVGVPGPLGPLASHTTVSVDNSPHAQGAAGLADPGYLIRAAAQLVAGVPTPMYCESAWPEGPDHTDCGAPGGAVAQSRTASGSGPDATATAGLGQVAVGSGAPALTVAAQSTTSAASLGADGVLHARADVTLSGIAVAGGAVRIGTLAVHREAAATGLPGGAQTSTAIALAGASVGGTPVDPGSDPVRSLAEAARKAFGDTIVVEGLSGRQQQTPDGKLSADSAGLQITWRPQKDRSVRIVLGYGRVLVYATPPLAPAADVAVPGAAEPQPGPAPSLAHGVAGGGATPSVPEAAPQPGSGASSAAAQPGPGPVVAPPAGNDASASPPRPAPPPGHTAPAGDGAAAPLVPAGRPLAVAARRPVQWVSPFLVLAQMTTGRQVWWFLLALGPLVAAAWFSRRGGMGLLAPWAASGRQGGAE
jgi:hypothetical protein